MHSMSAQIDKNMHSMSDMCVFRIIFKCTTFGANDDVNGQACYDKSSESVL